MASSMNTLDARIVACLNKAKRWPEGPKLPPFTKTLLPERLFPPTRDVPSPIHPLFPAPSPFPQDPSRYIYPEQSYIQSEQTTSDSNEVKTMSKLTPSYATNALGDKKFFCANGETYANLRELHVGLLTMREENFSRHVSSTKNDFASWVMHVFADKTLAKDMSRVKSRALTAYKVGQKLKQLRVRRNAKR